MHNKNSVNAPLSRLDSSSIHFLLDVSQHGEYGLIEKYMAKMKASTEQKKGSKKGGQGLHLAVVFAWLKMAAE